MYAVIKTGGKQYRIAKGDKVKVEKLNAEVGSTVDLTDVLLVANGEDIVVGSSAVASAKVTVEIIEHGRSKKVNIVKFKRRKHHLKRQGHRQDYTEIRVLEIAH